MKKSCWILLLMIFFQNMFVSANSYEIQVYYENDVKFSLYHVADIQDDEFIFTQDFKEICEHLLWNEDYEKNATTLKAYVDYQQIQPLPFSFRTESGITTFSNLKQKGLYLLVGENHYLKGDEYMILPTLLYVSCETPIIKVYPKYSKVMTHTTLDILKVWNDSLYEHEPIEIEIFNENETITIELNENNNWRKQINVNNEYYQVIEKNIPDGYKVMINQQNNAFIITNTKTNQQESTLPNTGTLGWLVPILLISGITLIIVGYSIK